MRGFVSKLAGLALSLGMLAFAGEAAAGCNSGCAPPAPPTPPHNPGPPNMPCHSCGGGGGGGNTNVNVNVNVKASASGSASAFAGSSSGSTVYGGGYGNWSQTPGYAQPVGGLAVVTGDEGAYEAISESRSVTRTLIIQASCLDDTGVPHPASQVFSDRDVANSYSGELYRCIAGTHMQIVMADCLDGAGGFAADHAVSESSSYSRSEEREEHSSYGHGSHGYASGNSESQEEHASSASGTHRVDAACLSRVNFDGGKTMTCQKGDALWFDHGNMTCRAQIPARQCNERSLLRRFGVGMKMLTVTRSESFSRKREVTASRSSSSVMVFDGGVGGFVQ